MVAPRMAGMHLFDRVTYNVWLELITHGFLFIFQESTEHHVVDKVGMRLRCWPVATGSINDIWFLFQHYKWVFPAINQIGVENVWFQ